MTPLLLRVKNLDLHPHIVPATVWRSLAMAPSRRGGGESSSLRCVCCAGRWCASRPRWRRWGPLRGRRSRRTRLHLPSGTTSCPPSNITSTRRRGEVGPPSPPVWLSPTPPGLRCPGRYHGGGGRGLGRRPTRTARPWRCWRRVRGPVPGIDSCESRCLGRDTAPTARQGSARARVWASVTHGP